ncbi:MAG: cation diffusion facilitator family transporter [Candidatus Omnitrophota bacterium]
MQTKSAQIKKTLILTLFLNWLVALAKLVVGKQIASTSMFADGIHSFSDSASNIIGLVGIWLAYMPKDEDHPYGHKKFETFASLGIVLLLMLGCVNIIHESIERFKNPVIPQVSIISIGVMLATMIINLIVMLYERRRGIVLNSDILKSDSMHTSADILTSLSVLFSFAAVKMGFIILDPVIALIITIFIGKVAIEIISDASKVLCDATIIDSKKIEQLCLTIPGVIKCHKIRTRGRPDDIYVDLHILVNKDTKIVAAHNLSSIIEKKIKSEIVGVSDVVVHIEPCDGHCD